MADGSPTESPCVFCAVIDGLDPAAGIVARTEHTVAFLDRAPLFHGHTLVVPRRHLVTVMDLGAEEIGPYWRDVQRVAGVVREVMGATGVFVAANNIVSQSVPHLHTHVVPRTKGEGLRGFFWPRTAYTEGQREAVAARLRAGFASTFPG
jgi:histidine triad (HIT) family protein